MRIEEVLSLEPISIDLLPYLKNPRTHSQTAALTAFAAEHHAILSHA